jgi:type I restriction enzyme S subunit
MKWETVSLGDVLHSIIGGGTPSKSKSEYWNGDIFWCSVKDMEDDKHYLSYTKDTITKKGLENSSANLIKAGTVITSTRMGLGRAFINKVDMAINQDLKALIPNERIDNRFLLWTILSKRNELNMLGRGSTVKGITLDILKSIEISLPPLIVQRRIADILSAYDDLIENNQKQIKLLEEAAMRLYKEWFVNLRFPGYENTKIVDGVPEGWEYKEVGSLISKTPRTKQVKKSEYNNSGEIPIIDQSREFIAGYTDDRETIVDLGVPVIVFGDHTRILKLINFPFAKGADGTQLIVSGVEEMPQHLLYCSLLNIDLSNYHYARHFKYLKASKIIVPTKNISEEFESIVEIYFKVIQILIDKIFLLQKSRDFLLPKLMNGEIEV